MPQEARHTTRPPFRGRPLATAQVVDGRRLSTAAVWPAIVVMLVLAGSLSPFAFDANGTWGLQAIGAPPSPLPDLVTNVFVYVPIGAAVCLWLRRRLGRLSAVAVAVAVGGLVSLAAESAQTLVSVRTASWTDVKVNLIGTLLGALLSGILVVWARTMSAGLRRGFATRPATAAAATTAVVLLLAGLCPFDFVGSTEELHRSLAGARWIPLASSFGDDVPAAPHRPLVGALGLAGVFAAYAFLAALSAREDGRTRRNALDYAIGHAAILALLVETMQVFLISRSFDTVEATLNIVAAALGAYLAVVGVDAPSRSGWLTRPSALLHPSLLVPALLGQVGYRILDALAAAKPVLPGTGALPKLWMPFAASYGRPLTLFLAEAAWVCVVSAVLALTVAVLSRRAGPIGRWLVAGAVVVGTSAACQGIEYWGQSRSADLTDLVLAAIGLLLAASLCRHLQPLEPAHVPPSIRSRPRPSGGRAHPVRYARG